MEPLVCCHSFFMYSLTGQFGSLCWSSCEKNLLYIAERKKLKSVSYFDSKPKKEMAEDGEKPVKVK